jgi:Domain of unknown function (DUF4926)
VFIVTNILGSGVGERSRILRSKKSESHYRIYQTLMNQAKLFDQIALLKPIPTDQLKLIEADFIKVDALLIGLVGTIVEIYFSDEQLSYLIEFSDSEGCEYAMAILKIEDFLVLHHELTNPFTELAIA